MAEQTFEGNLPEINPFTEVEREINLIFNVIFDVVRKRKETVLAELSALRQYHEEKNVSAIVSIKDLEASKAELDGYYQQLKVNIAKLEMEKTIKKLEQQLFELRKDLATVNVLFSCDTHKMGQDIANFGQIIVTSIQNTRDYSLIESPVKTLSKFGLMCNEFIKPRGVHIDNSTDIAYIADSANGRIQMWKMEGEYVAEFGRETLKYPYGTTILDGAIFITDLDHNSIFKFNLLDYSLIARSDSISPKCKLENPYGICSEADEVFVLHNDKCIEVFNNELSYERSISSRIKSCTDMKIRNSILYLLEVKKNEIKLINSKKGNLIKSINTKKDGVSFGVACHFCLDQKNNFLITNWKTNQIKIVSEDGDVIRLIDTTEWNCLEPMGIAISHNRIVVVFQSGEWSQIHI
ncbi:NHL repeat containing protein [Oopsacas minuta]|uniref:NHL repeat containing protein n=1 Tax=Oopsacas minuta TaxID=111878 RepID=A0AAV7K6W2_9METZ|nr:NHL repeat containing protein [Oopsacas minuta]